MNCDVTQPLVSPTHIDTFRRDGVVHIEHAFEPGWLELLDQGIEADLGNPSPRFEERRSEPASGRYCEDYWVWSRIPQFETFVRESPAARLAAAVLGASRINLVMDNWFMREAGSVAHAPWHHDIAYFDFEGRMCVLWLPLEATGKSEGIEFVRGSHLWDKLFMRIFFDGHQAAQPPGWVNGRYYDLPPDIDRRRDEFDVVGFDLQPGDCLLFDIRTLHGSPPDVVPTRTTATLHAQNGR